MDAKQIRSTLEQRRQEHQQDTYSVQVQGKRITLYKSKHTTVPRPIVPRGIITTFSRRARARRLRRITQIDWRAAGDSTFLTLTYPDLQSDHSMQERKNHRYMIHRYLEKDGPTPMLWRVEWMPRKSGMFVGQLRPHMHMIYLSKIYLVREKHAIARTWESIIGASQKVQVRVTDLTVGDIASVYAAKYCSKEASPSYLDNVPYRNRTGRHAGEVRSKLIPLHPEHITRNLDREVVATLKKRASETLWWYDARFDEGFTILGEKALEIIREFSERRIDSMPRPE